MEYVYVILIHYLSELPSSFLGGDGTTPSLMEATQYLTYDYAAKRAAKIIPDTEIIKVKLPQTR